MKFTKTVAISLLILGTMQFAMAETINIDGKEALTLQNTKGDTLDLQLTVCEGSCGEELFIQTPEYLTYTKSKTSVDRAHNLYTINLKFNDTPSNKPLVISTALPNGTVKSHTITFKPPFEPALLAQIMPAEKPAKQVIDVDLTNNKTGGEINLIKLVQAAGNNKLAFETGDIIHLILFENPTTGYRNVLLSLPSFLHLKNYAYEAPKQGLMGAPGTRHIDLEIAKDISGMDLTKPLIISYARAWEADRPATYTISFKMAPPAPQIAQAAPEKERALGSKFNTPKNAKQ